ncbi:hypothetical protein OCK74_19805 [Chitinophagaceae bacterium LB-8]|jgi:hypothetical protein|uniref:Uncharacterized protein n=1 Tax=Paraflavisolibacter caeni TaxID=2982496 RepID=A0A9X3BIH7_9BACT|nr:hypothetical protein [Paraflavisolibacter caeni]MCU7551377.1 hypothetical protein [Paraflavisolibacter caeni]
MKVECNDQKTFRLTEQAHLLGELTYKNFFSYKAEITLTNSERYEIKPVGFFGTSITVTKNETEITDLKMNWKGQIVMTFQDGQEFVFKAKGVFRNKYVIENKEEEELILFDPKFNWGQFNYDYEISYDKKPQDILLVLLGVYASNYYIAVVSGAI